jgi:hypothetical protein
MADSISGISGQYQPKDIWGEQEIEKKKEIEKQKEIEKKKELDKEKEASFKGSPIEDKSTLGKEAKDLKKPKEEDKKENPYDNLLKSFKNNMDKQIQKAQPSPIQPQPIQTQSQGTRSCMGGG